MTLALDRTSARKARVHSSWRGSFVLQRSIESGRQMAKSLSLAPLESLAANHFGWRPRPVQVSAGMSLLRYLMATLPPLPRPPPNSSVTVKPAFSARDAILCFNSARSRSFAFIIAFLTRASRSRRSLSDILSTFTLAI